MFLHCVFCCIKTFFVFLVAITVNIQCVFDCLNQIKEQLMQLKNTNIKVILCTDYGTSLWICWSLDYVHDSDNRRICSWKILLKNVFYFVVLKQTFFKKTFVLKQAHIFNYNTVTEMSPPPPPSTWVIWFSISFLPPLVLNEKFFGQAAQVFTRPCTSCLQGGPFGR